MNQQLHPSGDLIPARGPLRRGLGEQRLDARPRLRPLHQPGERRVEPLGLLALDELNRVPLQRRQGALKGLRAAMLAPGGAQQVRHRGGQGEGPGR